MALWRGVSLVGKLPQTHILVQAAADLPLRSGRSLFLCCSYCHITELFGFTGRVLFVGCSFFVLFFLTLFYSFSFQRVIASPLDCFIWKETSSAHPHYHPNIKLEYVFARHSRILSKTGRLVFCFENKRYRMR